jgi:long-chain fatty acid transport protein
MRIGNGALAAGVAFGIVTTGIGQALAGGFAIREQSAYGQGTSFAGIAAGGALSGMFWNPAVMTQFTGINFESGLAGILPQAEHVPGLGTFPPLLALGGVDNSGENALVPSAYASWQVNPSIWVGLSVNSPFGLAVNFPNVWAGRNYAMDSELKSYNATPSVAVRINEWLSVGAGVQIMYATANLKTGLPLPPAYVEIDGNGWAYGFTAGATITPWPTTQIGIGWRSALDLDIDGTLRAVTPVGTPSASATTTVKLPDIVTASIRHRVTPAVTLLGTVEWSNWSRIGQSVVTNALLPAVVAFDYRDGWFFSAGAEYAYSDRLTFRAGLAYEITPIDDRVRTPRLPDNDRIWTSVGLSYRALASLWLDLAYTHIFVDDTPIRMVPGNPSFVGVPYIGTVNSSVDIISVGLRYRFGGPEPAPAPPLVVKG